MATILYQECYGRAHELRERLQRMRHWFDHNAEVASDEELGWRRERYEAAQREYEELLQIIRSYGKAPAGKETASDTGAGLSPLGLDEPV